MSREKEIKAIREARLKEDIVITPVCEPAVEVKPSLHQLPPRLSSLCRDQTTGRQREPELVPVAGREQAPTEEERGDAVGVVGASSS
jgi:hypothetical protein